MMLRIRSPVSPVRRLWSFSACFLGILLPFFTSMYSQKRFLVPFVSWKRLNRDLKITDAQWKLVLWYIRQSVSKPGGCFILLYYISFLSLNSDPSHKMVSITEYMKQGKSSILFPFKLTFHTICYYSLISFHIVLYWPPFIIWYDIQMSKVSPQTPWRVDHLCVGDILLISLCLLVGWLV